MTLGLTGTAGLVVLILGVGLALVLDLPGGPAGWRVPGPVRRALIGATAVVTLVAMVATWYRIHP